MEICVQNVSVLFVAYHVEETVRDQLIMMTFSLAI